MKLPPRPITITFTVEHAHGPALRSAVDEIRSLVGTRLESSHKYAREDALTLAACALGRLHAAVCAQVPRDDPRYSLGARSAKAHLQPQPEAVV